MNASGMIGLFTEPAPPAARGPSPALVSIFVHGCLFIAVMWVRPPRPVERKATPRRYEVRIMELQPAKPQLQYVERQVPKAGEPAPVRALASSGSPGQAAAPHVPADLSKLTKAVQTIIQPDAPDNLTLAQVAVPQVMVWQARDITVKKIVTLPQQTVATIAVAPSLAPPNLAQRLADVRIAPSPTPAKTPLPPPSNTSPVTVAAAAPAAAHIPMTASKAAMQVVPTSAVSLSDVQLQQGTIALPPMNEVSPTVFQGPLAPGQQGGVAEVGRGSGTKPASGTGPGSGPGAGAGNAVAAAGGPGGQGGVNNGTGGAGGGAGLGAGGALGTAANGGYTVAHVTLPREGKFGVVVVGSSIAEDYPETVGIWSGRLAYTVYLHVGASKNWILQYSIPRLQDAATGGSVAKLDAPWPFDILRPSIDPDVNSDAIMVHGFVNTTGEFEHLAVVFPDGLAEAHFLLRALQQWHFRPAIQNGQATEVEVLLIIPNEAD